VVSVVNRRSFEGSGLTRAGQRGATYLGADSVGERIAATVRAAHEPGSLTYLYDGDLDATGHRHGCESRAWRYQLATVDGLAQTLREALPAGTALVVVADHGMVDSPLDRRVDIDAEPSLARDVILVGGEARFRHLYCGPGTVDGVVSRWRDRLGDRAVVVDRSSAIESGWFGPVDAAVRPRLGDVLVASLGDLAVVSTGQFPHEATMVGLHGSLSADEMLVPLLCDAGPAS
jgi:hypothetical protein